MFTGLVEEVGKIKALKSQELHISCSKVLEDAAVGDSIAVNGLCLTITKIYPGYASFHISPTTKKHSRFSPGEVKTGELVNLERALRLDTRLGGHMVSGHVDGKAKIIALNRQGEDIYIEFLYPSHLKNFIVNKGSVCIDGISLTVSELKSASFTITVIPHTLDVTNLQQKRIGDYVHIEVDMIARYLYHFYLTGGSYEKGRGIIEELHKW